MAYLPFVDGLRAVAIAAVIGYHAFPSAIPGGFVGVDVFFVISGFLITRFIDRDIALGQFSLLGFFTRRARRLLPAALMCFAGTALLSAIVLLPDAFWYLGRSLLSAVLMYANIFFYHTGGYFASPSLEKPLLHIWSLAVEDQFYATWPLALMLLSPRLPRPVIVAVTAVILLASLAYAENRVGTDAEFAFFLLPTRAWELLTGAMLALCNSRFRFDRPTSEILAGGGLIAIVASFWLLSSESKFPGLAAVPACGGAAAIIAAGVTAPAFVTRLLACRPMVFLGLISYSLYLWHWPLISLVSYRLERQLHPAEATLVVGLSLVLAILSWRFVEKPFRSQHQDGAASKATAADSQFVRGALASVVAFSLIAGAIKISKGWPGRFGPSTRPILEALVAGNSLRPDCDNFQNIFVHDDVCNFGRKKLPGESYQIALFGDSMADHWVPLIAKYAEAHNLSGRQITNGGCGLFFGTEIPAAPIAKAHECTSYQQEALKFIEANPNLKVAVLSGFWEKWLARFERPGEPADLPAVKVPERGNSSTTAPRFDAVLNSTLKVFSDRGIRVLLIGQIPSYDILPVRCIFKAVESGADPSVCGMSKAAALSDLHRSNAALDRAAQGNSGVSDSLPSEFMCQTERCSPVNNGVLLYKNGSHLNRFGAAALSPNVVFPLAQ